MGDGDDRGRIFERSDPEGLPLNPPHLREGDLLIRVPLSSTLGDGDDRGRISEHSDPENLHKVPLISVLSGTFLHHIFRDPARRLQNLYSPDFDRSKKYNYCHGNNDNSGAERQTWYFRWLKT